MKTMKTGVILLALLLAVMAMISCGGARTDDGSITYNSDEKNALQMISETNNIPIEQLIVLNSATAKFPLTKKTYVGLKILDVKTRMIYNVYINNDGKPVEDPKKYVRDENDEFVKKYGKFDPELSNRLKIAKSDERIPVWIWLTNPSNVKPIPEGDFSENEKEKLLQNQRSLYLAHSKDLVDFLTQKDFTINYVSQYSPSLSAEVTIDGLKELNERSDIAAISLQKTYEPSLYSTARAVKATSVWSSGISGTGVQVAVVEKDRIEYANPYLANNYYFNASGPISDHPTAVAGMIASTHSTNKGIAFDSDAILSANAGAWNDSLLQSAAEWAITHNADILSNSYGRENNLLIDNLDRFFDYIVWSDHKTVIVAAGNSASGGTGQTLSPGLGYNMITVGAFDDKDTSTWNDDTMASYSSYKNPHSQYEDREKPEVIAPGGESGSSTMTTTLASSPWIGDAGSGTSLSAPVVAGESALMMEADSDLKDWPETVKAIIMASARHNLEGESRLSDHDGSGGIDVSKAINIIDNSYYQSYNFNSDDFPHYYDFYVQKNKKVRVVVSWDSQPTSGWLDDPLKSDLDLVVWDPSGNYVTNSGSYDNNYEIVEFTAPSSGTYQAQLDQSRFDGDNERVGFAYCIF